MGSIMNQVSLYKEKNFKNIEIVHYMLGSACNMKCRHCVQNFVEKCVQTQQDMSDKVFDMLNHYIAYCVANRCMATPSEIMFWGGEPLVYWKQIQKIIERFDKIWNLSELKNFRFSVFTNGKLLDKEKIEFLERHNVYIYFSYDAPYPWAVRDYVSDDICKMIDGYPYCKVISNGCSHNMDLLLSRKCLKAKFPHVKKFGLGAYGFHANRTFNIPGDIYHYDWDNFRLVLRRIRIATQLKDKDAWDIMYSSIFRFLKPEFHSKFPDDWEPGCIMGKFLFSVTPDGKIPICHNTNKWIGTIDDSLETICTEAKKYVEKIKNPHCKKCPHIDVCHGICPEELRTEDGNTVICRDFRNYFYPILKEEFLKLNESLSEEDKAWYIDQEKIIKQKIQEFLLEGQRYEKEHTRFPKTYYYEKRL